MPAEDMKSHEVIGLGIDVLDLFHAHIELGQALNEALDRWLHRVPHAADPMIQALQKVHAALNEISDFALAAWVTSREDNLAFLLAHSSAALQTMNNFLQSGAPRSDPVWAPKIALAERDSLVAVQTFTGSLEGGFWLRPESVKAMSWAGDPTSSSEGWMPHMADRAEMHASNRVWDHRWALPAAVYTITARIAVLRASGADAAAARSEIEKYHQFIGQVFRKMESGIRSLDRLDDVQINRIPTHGVPIAVADIYGGYYVGGQFDPMFQPHYFTRVPFPAELMVPTSGHLDLILRNAKMLTQHWRNHVAVTIGLPDVLQFAGKLERILAQPAAPIVRIDPRPHGDWTQIHPRGPGP